MSNEPTTGAPMSSEASNEPSPRRAAPPQDGFDADTELVLTGLERIVARIRGERSLHGALAGALGEMAGAIAKAKMSLPAGDGPGVAALLDELEHRVDAMLGLIGGGQAAERPVTPTTQPPKPKPESKPASAGRVPTVSGVVSRLGGEEAPEATADAGVPTVAMLEAMVEAMNTSASAPAAAPGRETAKPEPTAPQATQPQPQPDEAASEQTQPPLPSLEMPEAMPAWRDALGQTSEPDAQPVEAVSLPVPDAIPPVALEQPPQAAAGFDWMAALAEDLIATPASKPHEEPAEPAAPPPAAGPPSGAKKSAADPLAAIMALSPEEKIALFS